ncbi:MAG: hypothetical protein Q8P50_10290 [Bacillota bacterium]|nr:hypothetical protein [Bacillota bacterium]
MKVKTQFVMDRFAETPYEQRSYIFALVTIEEWVTRKANSYASAMLITSLRTRHPVEWEFISRELNEGYIAPADEVRQALDGHKAQIRTAELEKAKAEAEHAISEWKAWRKAGGRA